MTTNNKRYHWSQWPVSLNTRKRFQMYNNSNKGEHENGGYIDICTILYDYFDSIYCSRFERKTCVVVVATNFVQKDKNLKIQTKKTKYFINLSLWEIRSEDNISESLYWKFMVFSSSIGIECVFGFICFFFVSKMYRFSINVIHRRTHHSMAINLLWSSSNIHSHTDHKSDHFISVQSDWVQLQSSDSFNQYRIPRIAAK